MIGCEYSGAVALGSLSARRTKKIQVIKKYFPILYMVQLPCDGSHWSQRIYLL
jgi:hypothetical protein